MLSLGHHRTTKFWKGTAAEKLASWQLACNMQNCTHVSVLPLRWLDVVVSNLCDITESRKMYTIHAMILNMCHSFSYMWNPEKTSLSQQLYKTQVNSILASQFTKIDEQQLSIIFCWNNANHLAHGGWTRSCSSRRWRMLSVGSRWFVHFFMSAPPQPTSREAHVRRKGHWIQLDPNGT